MEQSRLQIALTVFAMLFPAAVTAQNPCGYAFTITGDQLYDQHCAACHGIPDTTHLVYLKLFQGRSLLQTIGVADC